MAMCMVMWVTMAIFQVENWTQVLRDNGNEWPEEPDPEWNITTCLHGWNYDRLTNIKCQIPNVKCFHGWNYERSLKLFFSTF